MFLIDDLVNNKLQVKPDTIPIVVAAYLIFLMVKTKRILPVKLHQRVIFQQEIDVGPPFHINFCALDDEFFYYIGEILPLRLVEV